jgi:hypothetical protein
MMFGKTLWRPGQASPQLPCAGLGSLHKLHHSGYVCSEAHFHKKLMQPLATKARAVLM